MQLSMKLLVQQAWVASFLSMTATMRQQTRATGQRYGSLFVLPHLLHVWHVTAQPSGISAHCRRLAATLGCLPIMLLWNRADGLMTSMPCSQCHEYGTAVSLHAAHHAKAKYIAAT